MNFFFFKTILYFQSILKLNPMQIKHCLKIRRFKIDHNLATLPYWFPWRNMWNPESWKLKVECIRNVSLNGIV